MTLSDIIAAALTVWYRRRYPSVPIDNMGPSVDLVELWLTQVRAPHRYSGGPSR